MSQQEQANPEAMQQMRFYENQIRALVGKVGELQGEAKEHELAARTLADLDPERKAWRLINDVLVERTVGDVLPAVQANLSGIGDMIAQLQKEITAKRELMNQFALENGLAKRVAPQGGADDGADEE